MIELHDTKCCAVGEINNLSHSLGPLGALVDLQESLRKGYVHYFKGKTNHLKPFIVFTGVVTRVIPDHASRRLDNYGQAFADYLVSNGLGTVTQTPPQLNWTGNDVVVWVWCPDYDRLFEFYEGLARDMADLERLKENYAAEKNA